MMTPFMDLSYSFSGFCVCGCRKTLSFIKENHAIVGRRPASGQPRCQAAHMRFQLMAVRIEEVHGVAFAAVSVPFRHASVPQAGGKGREISLGDGKRRMRIAGAGKLGITGLPV